MKISITPSRLERVALCAAVAWLMLMSPATFAQTSTFTQARTTDSQDAVENALDHALTALVAYQHADGVVREAPHQRPAPPRKYAQHTTANTALLLLALSANGHPPSEDTPLGHAAHAALKHLLAPGIQTPNGNFGHADASRMYGHAITLLALTRVAGQTGDPQLDQQTLTAAQNAVDLLIEAQRVKKSPAEQGGWRYLSYSRQSDLSVTAWCVEALWEARRAGLNVSPNHVIQAAAYVQQNAAQDGPRYRPNAAPTPASHAAGHAILTVPAFAHSSPPTQRSPSDWPRPPLNADTPWLFFALLHQRHAASRTSPDELEAFAYHAAHTLLPLQRADSLWVGRSYGEKDAFLATALACIILAPFSP